MGKQAFDILLHTLWESDFSSLEQDCCPTLHRGDWLFPYLPLSEGFAESWSQNPQVLQFEKLECELFREQARWFQTYFKTQNWKGNVVPRTDNQLVLSFCKPDENLSL